ALIRDVEPDEEATQPKNIRASKSHSDPFPDLTDAQWAAISPLLHERHREPVIRRRIAAMAWVLETGVGWRALSPGSNRWTTYYNIHRQWRQSGLWDRLWETMAAFPAEAQKPPT